MKKTKIAVIAILMAVLTACCIAFVACAPEPEVEYEVKWQFLDENVESVKINGYNEVPEKFKEGTEVVFSVVCKEDFMTGEVTPRSAVKAQDDGTFKFTVDGELTVKISSKPKLNTYEITGVKLETGKDGENDAIFFVVEGTYEGKPKYTLAEDLYFITKDNCFLQTNTWWDNSRPNGGSGTVTQFNAVEGKRPKPNRKFLTTNDDGTFEAKINISELTVYWYAVGLSMGYDEDLNEAEMNYTIPSWTSEGFSQDVEFDGKNFKLQFDPSGQAWMSDGLAIIVTAIAAE